MKNHWIRNNILPLVAISSFFTYWLITNYISHDFVWDELVSLKNFVMVDLYTTVTHYPDVNNHILFNFINNLYCSVLGLNNQYEAMDNIELLRLYPLVLTIVTGIYTFKIGNKFFGEPTGLLALIILVTTLPFLNFTMQMRGYTLTIMLMAMNVYYLWLIEEKFNWLTFAAIVVLQFALMYAIPSNVYFSIAFGVIYFSKWVISLFTKSSTEETNWKFKWVNADFKILLAILIGCALSALAYLPILDDLINERHLLHMKERSHYWHNITSTFPSVFYYLLSFRFLLLVPLFTAAYFFLKSAEFRRMSLRKERVLFLIAIVVIPILIALIRDDKPHQRTFTPFAVITSLFLAIFTTWQLNSIQRLNGKVLLNVSIVFIYCLGSYFFCDYKRQQVLSDAIKEGKLLYNMFYNFYQSDKYGSENLIPLIEAARIDGFPIIMAKEADRVMEGEFLIKHGINYFSTVWSREVPVDSVPKGFEYHSLLEVSRGRQKDRAYVPLAFPAIIEEKSSHFVPLFTYLYDNKVFSQKDPKLYVLTSAPYWFEGVMRYEFNKLNYKRLNPRISYHNVYLITK